MNSELVKGSPNAKWVAKATPEKIVLLMQMFSNRIFVTDIVSDKVVQMWYKCFSEIMMQKILNYCSNDAGSQGRIQDFRKVIFKKPRVPLLVGKRESSLWTSNLHFLE